MDVKAKYLHLRAAFRPQINPRYHQVESCFETTHLHLQLKPRPHSRPI